MSIVKQLINPGNNPEADKLIKTINEYYNLEKSESWDKAYEYRTPLFRQTVMKDFYIKQMSKDNAGWQLIRFEILDLKIENNRAIAKIKFTEESPREINFGLIKINKHNMIIEQDTKWKKYGNTWFGLDPGDRTHLHDFCGKLGNMQEQKSRQPVGTENLV